MLREACSNWFGQNGWEKAGQREHFARNCYKFVAALVSNIVIQHGCPNFQLALFVNQIFLWLLSLLLRVFGCCYGFHFIWHLYVWHSAICDNRLEASILKTWLLMWIVFRNCCAQVLHGGDTLSAGRTAEFVHVGPCVVSVHVQALVYWVYCLPVLHLEPL